MPKAHPTIYLSPSEKINDYILYDPVKKTIFESSSVVFDEYVFGVLNLLKCIDRGNIPHYFNTYLNEKFIDFLKLSNCDDVLSMNTNSMDCIHENLDDSAEIVIDNDYPVDVERKNRIDHFTPAPVNLHSKHTALNEKTHSMNVYSDDDDDEMVLLSMPPFDFTQSNGFYTLTSSSCSSCFSSSSSSSPIVDPAQVAAAVALKNIHSQEMLPHLMNVRKVKKCRVTTLQDVPGVEITKILAERGNEKKEYLVEWLGYGQKKNSWVGAASLKGNHLLFQFRKTNAITSVVNREEESSSDIELEEEDSRFERESSERKESLDSEMETSEKESFELNRLILDKDSDSDYLG